MRRVAVARKVPGTVHEAETLWLDTRRWPSWVDGLDHVVEVVGEWPQPGSRVVWRSGPAGRGTVTERVLERLALEGMTVQVEDGAIKGRQRVTFLPEDDGVQVELSLEYELVRRTLFTPAIDLLFIRKAFERSLSYTLERFAVELRTARGTTLG